MAISDSQKVDLLFKKVGYGVAKTDTSTNKSPANEANASPMVSPGTTIYQQDYAISNVTTLPTSNSSVVTVYRDSLTSTVQCTKLPTTSANVSWSTGLTDWIPVQYGTGYQVKLYAGPAGSSTPQNYTNLPADGSGNNDSWYFDYQSGIVNFADTNVPTAASSGGNVVYAVGARYTGLKGITSFANLSVQTLSVSGNITANVIGNVTGNIFADSISPYTLTSTMFTGTAGIVLPTGTTGNRPAGSAAGQLRFNTDLSTIEFYTGSGWMPVTNSITDQQITPDGVSLSFTLNQASTSAGALVSINGTVQTPGVAYSVSGTTITFAETPQVSDIIDVRFIASAVTALDTTVVDTSNVTVGTSNVTLDYFDISTFRSAKYTISSSNSTDYTMAEVMLIQNGTTSLINTFGVINTGSNTLNFYANVYSGNAYLIASGTTASNQLRIQRTYFRV